MGKDSYIKPGCMKCGSFDCHGIKIVCETCELELCSNECRIVENKVCHRVVRGHGEEWWCDTKTELKEGIPKYTNDKVWVEDITCTGGGYYGPPDGFTNSAEKGN